MKRSVIIIVITFICTILSVPASAHSGGTDSDGGHNSPSGYHYHHGYPAHSHSGGVCPYDFEDNTTHNNSQDQSDTESYDRYASNFNISESIDGGDSNNFEGDDFFDDNAFTFPAVTDVTLPESVDSDNLDDNDSSDDSGSMVFLKVILGIALYIGVLISAAVIPEAILKFVFFVILKIPADDEDKFPLQLTRNREIYKQNHIGIKKQIQQNSQYEEYLSFISDD